MRRASSSAPGTSVSRRGCRTSVPPVHADRDRLVQVLINLLSNAAKFVRAGRGRVVVELFARRRARCASQVIGQRPRHQRRDQKIIFEKFRQAGDTMTEKPQGTGLGLPISRQIIEHLGGRLWVEASPAAARRSPSRCRLGVDAPDAASRGTRRMMPTVRVMRLAPARRRRSDGQEDPDRRRRAQHRGLARVPDEAEGLRRQGRRATARRRSAPSASSRRT